MKNTIKLLTIISVLFSFFCCEKYEMIKYGEGGEINFMTWDDRRDENDNPNDFVWKKNFGINPLGDSLHIDTMIVGVKIMGQPVDYDRKIAFKLGEQTGGGKLEIRFLPGGYVIPAGKGTATLKILVTRPIIRDSVCKANLLFDYEASDFKPGTIERQAFKIECFDKVNMELWGIEDPWEWEQWYLYDGVLGDWSEAKARFIITTMGVINFPKWANMTNYNKFIYADMPILYDAFIDYKAKSLANPQKFPPLYDETFLPNLVWIDFPKPY